MSKFAARVLCCALAFFACAFFLLLTSPLAAQEVTATISGTVTDPSGEIIPAVNVEVTNPETGARSTAVPARAANTCCRSCAPADIR